MHTKKRTVEVFSAGCQICNDLIEMVRNLACDSCEVTVVDTGTESGAQKAEEYGVKRIPAVAVNGSLLECCTDNGVDEEWLKQAGIGQSM